VVLYFIVSRHACPRADYTQKACVWGFAGQCLHSYVEIRRLLLGNNCWPSFPFGLKTSVDNVLEYMATHRIGIIGGSGLYHIEGFTQQKWTGIKTPFGAPSDDFLTGKLCGREVVFLPRHGRGHRLLPSD
jgi:hypothetical protein